jgi:hypothetical protein
MNIRQVKASECQLSIHVNEQLQYCRMTLVFNGFTGDGYFTPAPGQKMPEDEHTFRQSEHFITTLIDAEMQLNDGIRDTETRLTTLRRYRSQRDITRNAVLHDIPQKGWPFK